MQVATTEYPVIPGELRDIAMKSVIRTRYRALIECPYYGALGMSLKVVICNNFYGNPVGTAATDGTYLLVNPVYFLSLTENMRLSLFIHEVSHVALAHHLRREDRDPELWNEATDHAVNHQIKAINKPIGKGWLCDPDMKGWSAERNYGKIKKDPRPPPPVGPGGNPPGGGNPQPGATGEPVKQPGEVWDARNGSGAKLTEAEKEKAMRDLARDIGNAESVRRTAGNSEDALHDRAVNEVMSPTAGWESLLSEFWSGTGTPLNETWCRPNRRYLPAGIWAPSVDENGIDWVVIGIDVSGSIMQAECDAFVSQINRLREEVPAERITLVPFNSAIQNVNIVEIRDGDSVPSRFSVGGGTNFSSIINWVRRQEESPDSLIIFTDLGDNRYGEEPDCPVLWASSEPVYVNRGYNNRPPFGDIIEVEVTNDY